MAGIMIAPLFKHRLGAGFPEEEFRQKLGESLGFHIEPLVWLKCVNSINFKAVRASDGFVFSVKCVPDCRKNEYDRLVKLLDTTNGSGAVRRLFAEKCLSRFGDYHVVCLSWVSGHGVFPDLLSESAFANFLEEFLHFHKLIQGATAPHDIYPIQEWREALVRECHGFAGRMLKRYLDDAPAGESYYLKDRVSITHGDLHPGNFHYDGDRVSGFLDVESLTLSYPSADIVRYFIFSLDHLSAVCIGRRSRTYARFEEAVRYMPWPEDEWIVAINASWIEQLEKKVLGRGASVFGMIGLAARAHRYRRLRTIVRNVFSGARA